MQFALFFAPNVVLSKMGKLGKPQRSKKHKKIKAVDPFYEGDRKNRRVLVSVWSCTAQVLHYLWTGVIDFFINFEFIKVVKNYWENTLLSQSTCDKQLNCSKSNEVLITHDI